MDQLERLDHRDLLVRMEALDLLDPLGLLDREDQLVKGESLDSLDLQELLDHVDPLDLVDPEVCSLLIVMTTKLSLLHFLNI